jgi:putative ABC transport system permease protein
MTKFALKGLLGRKLRTALTALAIVLGVAMISGTYVLTDSIDSAFDTIFTEVRRGSSAVITGKAAFDLSEGSGATAPAFPESVLATVRGVDGVAQAEGSVDSDSTTLIGRDGKAVVNGGAPNLGFAIAQGDSPFNPLALVEGDWPGPDEVVIDSGTAKDEDFKIGDVIGVQAEGPVERLKVSGIVRLDASISIGGATLAGFDLPTAQRLFKKVGKLDEIAVAARAGTSDAQLISNINAVLPPGTQVRSGQAQAADDASETNEFITFLQGFLLAFAGIALFVGSFVIANSLSITIAQRAREFATVRTLGGSRRQILGSIVVEALVVGAAASVVGLFLGLGLAKLLFWLFDAVGFTLPNTGLLFETRTIIVSLAVGIIVTLLASLRPAIRATRVPPIAAVREGATLPESRFARFRTVGSLVTTGLGFAALLYGLFGGGLGTTQILIWMGVGALLIFIGVSLFAARLVRPLAATLGEPAAQFGGAAGRLARDNARRNPQRTASTASALMIGLALVTLVATLAAGITSTFRGAVDKIFISDYAITAQNNFSPIPIDAAAAAAKAPGVEAIASTRTGEARVFDSTEFVTAVEPSAGEVIRLDWVEGSQAVFRELGANGAFVDDGFAKDHGLSLGSPIRVIVPSGERLLALRRGHLRERDLRPGLRLAAEPLHVHSHAGRRVGAEHAGARGGARHRLPEREGADPRRVRRQPDRRAQPDPEHPLRAAGAVRDRESLRDRQHARAHRLRAHPRARDAARDRDDAASGAPDDPTRERDHGADRRHARNHPRRRPRRTPDRARRLHRVLAADDADHHLRDPDDRRRDRRRDLPGAPRRTAEPARGAPVRVASPRADHPLRRRPPRRAPE